jgi:adenine phosphoribosyltransferase
VNLSEALSLIRPVPNFPQPNILFQDITPLLSNSLAFKTVIDEMSNIDGTVEYVAGMEARGFIFAAAIASKLNCGFIPIRKSGKLPSRTFSESYGLEYGSDTLEIHQDACPSNSTVLIVDDVLATGGTACAAIKLAQKTGAHVSNMIFLVEISALKGRDVILAHFPHMKIHSLKIVQ